MNGNTLRRVPLDPLERYVELNYDPETMQGSAQEEGRPSAARVARLTGLARRTISSARRYGLTVHQADRAAVRLGVHPLDIWPDFHEDVAS